jgi:hypothetical protein
MTIEKDQYAMHGQESFVIILISRTKTERLILSHKFTFPGFFRDHFEYPELFKAFPN